VDVRHDPERLCAARTPRRGVHGRSTSRSCSTAPSSAHWSASSAC
jgi:hypothetical protein